MSNIRQPRCSGLACGLIHNTGRGCEFESYTYRNKNTIDERKATGNHLIKSTSLEKTQSPVSGFCHARNRVCNEDTNNHNSHGGDIELP